MRKLRENKLPRLGRIRVRQRLQNEPREIVGSVGLIKKPANAGVNKTQTERSPVKDCPETGYCAGVKAGNQIDRGKG